ncbi:uncharacterized protein BKCO1_1000640 [Diplodia corticola]|uniref:DUF7820 domain-containing protein n=1 Tax=Diplodia corticola TaxID=236234 RepID=A0A1J9RGC1_9PEZI|nr:uncharacterized protein BKCO1_1000640 [Diplodia corticola]OJD40582.1 hypothetical protein BKCO1_1000640 [Diplodia corticola]
MDGRQPPPSDDHATPSNSGNPNIFDDEYALERDQDPEFGMGVADGFRPGNDRGSGIASNSATALDHRTSIRSSVRHSISENFPLDTKGPPAVSQQRNSISKGGHAARGSFTMAQDGPNSQTPERNSTSSPAPRLPQLSHRISIASTSSFATEHASQSGFAAGNSGPSHPYGMYPQGTGLARSSSVTTTSTVQGPQRAMSQHGPAHPYAMYPQNVFDDPDEIRPAPVQNQIPVGFPGLGQGFHRQIGPDGEEQDIIGPDGHTEQLPPYSRFPEEGPTKASLMAVPEEFDLVTGTEAGVAAGATAGVAAGAAAGGLAASPAATHGPSMSQEGLPSSNSSMMMQPMANGQTTPQSQEPLQAQDRSASEEMQPDSSGNPNDKSWSEKSWQEKRKTRILWGKVPLWVFITALVIIVILAVILGVVIGTFMAKGRMDKNKDRPSMVTVVSTESLFDASSIQVIPTGLPALPVGKYALPIRSPDVSSNECLTSSGQNDAWSCNVDGPPLEINVKSYGKANSYAMWLSPLDNTTGVNYGSQAPNIDPQALSLVTDLDNPTDGPAWHFQTLYDKIVILRPEDFAAGSEYEKRDAQFASDPYPPDGFNMPSGFRSRHQVVAGDKPWYCIWNSTFIETFIYVEQNTSSAVSTGVSSAVASATNYATPAQSSSSVPTTTYPSPVTVVSTNSAAIVTTTPTPVERRSTPGDTDSNDIQWYPRIVKIEERRTSTKEQAYCQQMQLLDDGRMVPTLKDGKTIVVTLSESDPDYSDYKSGSTSKRSNSLHKRDDPSNACHCQWSFI